MENHGILVQILQQLKDNGGVNWIELIAGLIISVLGSFIFYYLVTRHYEKVKAREEKEREEKSSQRNKILALVSRMENLDERLSTIIGEADFGQNTVPDIINDFEHIYKISIDVKIPSSLQELIQKTYGPISKLHARLSGEVYNYDRFAVELTAAQKKLKAGIREAREEAIRLT